jgi:bifunctional NMN adenylyltransferase/nudix hydrolase
MRFDYLVLIGRFQPFHNGHHSILRHALRLAEKVIVLTGSAGQPRTIKNPFNAGERAVMIRAAAGEDARRLLIKPLRDHLYSDTLWWTCSIPRCFRPPSCARGCSPARKAGC